MCYGDVGEPLASDRDPHTLTAPSDGLDLRSSILLPLLELDAFVDLLPVDSDTPWRINSQTNLLAFDSDNDNAYVAPDHDCLAYLSTENEHFCLPVLSMA
jgi:hypothetical protein